MSEKLSGTVQRRQENVSVNLRKLVDKGLIGYTEDRIYPTWHAEELINPERKRKEEEKKGATKEEIDRYAKRLGI